MRNIVLLAAFWLATALATRGAEPQTLWLYVSRNLWVDQNIDELEALFRRAAQAGYTHVLLSDSKFSKLAEMDQRYFRNCERLKSFARELHLEIVPALFPIGYSNDLLWHNPNLIEGLPVQDAPLVVRNGEARPLPSPALLKGGDFADLKLWSWHDRAVTSVDGAALIRNPAGENARLVQKLKLTPYRQYHLSVRVKTAAFAGTPEVKVLAGNRALTYNSLGVKPTQDWSTHHVVFNSLEHSEASLYLGAWGARTGDLWFDDVRLDEVIFLNLIRRPGAPLTLKDSTGAILKEGADVNPLSDPQMGNRVWKGSYDIWHEPPILKTKLPDDTRLFASYYHAVTVHDDQAMICPSEPQTLELLRDQARRMHALWQSRGYMMSHDEIRVLNWCDACRKRNLDAGALLAENVRTCTEILRQVNPGGAIYVWSDMFDPHHNAHDDYYLVRGDLAGSWKGLDKDIIVVPWYFEKRAESLRWFSDLGNRQLIAGYYDHEPAQIRDWLSAARSVPGVLGVMYTTWEAKYSDLETFARFAKTSAR